MDCITYALQKYYPIFNTEIICYMIMILFGRRRS